MCKCSEYIMTESLKDYQFQNIYRCRNCELVYIKTGNFTKILGRQDKDFEQYWFYGY